MKARQDMSCWELFVNAIPKFNALLLKMLSVTILLSSRQVSSQGISASDSDKFTFFSRADNFPKRTLGDPCIQSYPGTYLSVTPLAGFYFNIAQNNNLAEVHQTDLKTQLEQLKFFGNVLCDRKLQKLDDKRFEKLQNRDIANSEYTVDFNRPDIIEIDILSTRARPS